MSFDLEALLTHLAGNRVQSGVKLVEIAERGGFLGRQDSRPKRIET